MDFVLGLLLDIAIIAGIVLLVLSVRKKHRARRFKMVLVGIFLVATGLVFLDWDELSEAYDRGYDAAVESLDSTSRR